MYMTTTPKTESRAEALAENRRRVARVCQEVIDDVRREASDGELEITIGFLETLLRQRRRIKAHRTI